MRRPQAAIPVVLRHQLGEELLGAHPIAIGPEMDMVVETQRRVGFDPAMHGAGAPHRR